MPTIFVLIEPTRGIDVGARADIYRRLDALAKAGKAIILVSSDLDEVLALADRILVVREGTISAETTPRLIDEEGLNLLVQGAGARIVTATATVVADNGRSALGGLLSRHAMLAAAILLCLIFVAHLAGVRNTGQCRQHTAAVGFRADAGAGDDARRAGGRHRPVGRLGGDRFGNAGRHRPRGRTAPCRCRADGYRHGRCCRASQRGAGRRPEDQPGDRDARHHDRGARPEPRRARALQFLAGDQGTGIRRPCTPHGARLCPWMRWSPS